ncbi:deaminase [Halarcobacter sp.]|uniref:deaminase n=1 Tax=Halarcobacter sp. TaxID=2321133 RepID=UPI003A8E1890
MKNDIQTILKNLRSEFIIVGLTGALGSGCTQTAKILSKNCTKEKLNSILDSGSKEEFDLEYRKIQNIKYFYKDNDWNEFFHIRVSDLLFLFFVNDIKDLDKYEDIFIEKSNIEEVKVLSNKFIEALFNYSNYDKKDIKQILIETNEYISKNINKSSPDYTPLFQDIGNSVRNKGKVFEESDKEISELLGLENEKDLNIFIIPEIIRRVIKLVRKENEDEKKKDFFVIDALRNIYEIEFFRNRYQSFYLFSIMASKEKRKDRIEKSFNLTPQNLKDIVEFETNDKGIESQAINTCIGKGDIFINNDKDDSTILEKQLVKYIALIRKPGLFTPNDDERFMQVAFTSRYNSGCISRQVGAVVVGEDGYLRGFGWNDTPEKHIPCLYRTPEQLMTASGNMVFSEYERSTEFYEFIKKDYADKEIRLLPFCFKDKQAEIELIDKSKKIEEDGVSQDIIYNILDKAKFKNPTRERALHAEENAFLQISKSGGESVINGTLYTTDSPCQLCAKKTMQLKMKRVVYIDAYPDISVSHTLNAGIAENWPYFDMFSGVIGSAYFKLYVPIIGRKDEIKELNK